MSVEVVLLGLVVLLLVAVLLLLLVRKPGADPTIPLLQAAQERQGERLGALAGEVKAALSASEAATGREIQGFSVEQTKVLSEGLTRLAQGTGTLQTDLAGKLEAMRAGLAEGQAEAAKALRAEMSEKLAAMNVMVEQVRAALTESQAAMRAAIALEMTTARDLIDRKALESRAEIEARLKEMREANDKRLTDIQASVNEKLGEAVEKQMTESFTRVIDQFNAIQAMMGNVQSVATQVGDLKRLFSNVKTRGGWGEAQVKAMLDDFLPEGSYEMNVKLREDSNEVVEFAIRMPTSGESIVRLPVDAKFPVEDYERLLAAHDAGDVAAEAQARRALEVRIRAEAQKIRQKYVHPPLTTEFAVLYLPTEGLYAEVARIPGLIEDVGHSGRVFIAGPSLLPAMLRTIQLGHVTLALSKNAEGVRDLLAATKAEMAKMDGVLEKLGKQVGTVNNTIGDARTRTRAIARKLKGVEAMPGEQSAAALGLDLPEADEDEPA
ncbi:DNA recombination protein RmuC [Roseococcus suduntuyensis]|uniref:DNA recombination protein RmuC homolog n=1 Tax=Roseococcus suduntuyensis TaxID=455361 RepID=A0A840A9Z5_9PROT|nr:DNA recombination protein RmuC [Roseococcus suduntuyensis]MBB3897712.1 DNA recombination protein RmuC [Roseococcus suduntuyensis]